MKIMVDLHHTLTYTFSSTPPHLNIYIQPCTQSYCKKRTFNYYNQNFRDSSSQLNLNHQVIKLPELWISLWSLVQMKVTTGALGWRHQDNTKGNGFVQHRPLIPSAFKKQFPQNTNIKAKKLMYWSNFFEVTIFH